MTALCVLAGGSLAAAPLPPPRASPVVTPAVRPIATATARHRRRRQSAPSTLRRPRGQRRTRSIAHASAATLAADRTDGQVRRARSPSPAGRLRRRRGTGAQPARHPAGAAGVHVGHCRDRRGCRPTARSRSRYGRRRIDTYRLSYPGTGRAAPSSTCRRESGSGVHRPRPSYGRPRRRRPTRVIAGGDRDRRAPRWSRSRGPDRQAVRVRGRRSERVRLLRADPVRLRPGRRVPAAQRRRAEVVRVRGVRLRRALPGDLIVFLSGGDGYHVGDLRRERSTCTTPRTPAPPSACTRSTRGTWCSAASSDPFASPRELSTRCPRLQYDRGQFYRPRDRPPPALVPLTRHPIGVRRSDGAGRCHAPRTVPDDARSGTPILPPGPAPIRPQRCRPNVQCDSAFVRRTPSWRSNDTPGGLAQTS